MELSAEVATAYVRGAIDQMRRVADRLGDDLVNERPVGEATNSVSGLVVHLCGMAEYWLGHEGLGRESSRDRDAEFRATATLAELHVLLDGLFARIETDIAELDRRGTTSPDAPRAAGLPGGDDPGSLVVHVLEEMYQHLGHMELTVDVLLARP